MNVLVVNAGSATWKLRLLGPGDELRAEATVPAERTDLLAGFVERVGVVDAVGHRVVHGGPHLRGATVIDERTERLLEGLTPLAPLHQPSALLGIREVRARLPDVPAVACFDTAFHATLAPAVATYALPREWRTRWPLRRYGFHGLSHAYATRRAPVVAGLTGRADLRVVTCHLGSGASLCATRDGRSADTTMGFTPLEGLVMGTRSGSVDPGLVGWLITVGGLTPDEVFDGLGTRSGLLGLAGTADMRAVLAGCRRGDPAAQLALDVYCHRLARELAAMTAAIGGLDLVAFTGGVGEHVPLVRAETAARLAHLGLALDEAANEAAAPADRDVSAPDAAVRTVVIEAREDLEIAAQVRRVLGGR